MLKENRREGMQLILPEELTPDLHRSFRSRTWELTGGAGGRPGTAPTRGYARAKTWSPDHRDPRV